MSDEDQTRVEEILETEHLAEALDSERFRRFLDHVPIAIIVAEMAAEERIVYANPRFTAVSGWAVEQIIGQGWAALPGSSATDSGPSLAEAIATESDFLGGFRIGEQLVDAYGNVIADDAGAPSYRLVALVPAPAAELRREIETKDALLREVQHRVKNNLQMITALIRIEARHAGEAKAPFDRLAGRVESIQLLYKLLTEHGPGDQVDLGVYLGNIATSVLGLYAMEGVRLDLQVQSCQVSVNVAMPTGLVVNELLTNALKHAFAGRQGGTITLHSLVRDGLCALLIADDGIGLPQAQPWPQPGKLSAAIVQSLRVNANAKVIVSSAPGAGTKVRISFPHG